jgi:hypothetical protein
LHFLAKTFNLSEFHNTFGNQNPLLKISCQKLKYQPFEDLLRIYMKLLKIKSAYMKNPAQASDFYNFDRLRFKSNIVKDLETDIYRTVVDITV